MLWNIIQFLQRTRFSASSISTCFNNVTCTRSTEYLHRKSLLGNLLKVNSQQKPFYTHPISPQSLKFFCHCVSCYFTVLPLYFFCEGLAKFPLCFQPFALAGFYQERSKTQHIYEIWLLAQFTGKISALLVLWWTMYPCSKNSYWHCSISMTSITRRTPSKASQCTTIILQSPAQCAVPHWAQSLTHTSRQCLDVPCFLREFVPFVKR